MPLQEYQLLASRRATHSNARTARSQLFGYRSCKKRHKKRERDKKNEQNRPVRELQSPPHGFMVVERAHGKVNQLSCSLLLSTLCFSFIFVVFSQFKRSFIPANLVGLSNAHFLAFVWLDKVRRPRKGCEGAEAGDVGRARPTPECARRLHGRLSAGSRGAERAGTVRTKHTQESGGYQTQSMVQTTPAPRLFPVGSPWDSTPQTR